jgi:gamma-glutamylcyclotransferase
VIYYFAYGSNLDLMQMRKRCPGSELVAPAVLADHTLLFAGYSKRWAGPVATVRKRPGHSVPGAVYRITRKDKRRLDGFEGCPFVYERRRVKVTTAEGAVDAYTYRMVDDRKRGRPSEKYLAAIVGGYHRLGFHLEAS